MNSLRKKYPFQLGKSFFKADSWLSLEVIAVLGIITTLTLWGIRITADYFYKVAVAAPLSHQFIEHRLEQQEYYAWHGNFNQQRKDYELYESSDYLPEFDQIFEQMGQFKIYVRPFQQYPSTTISLMLDDSFHSVIKPVCSIKQDETFYLMPYFCKEGSVTKKQYQPVRQNKTL